MAEGFSVGGLYATLDLDKRPYDNALDAAGKGASGLKGKLGGIGKGLALGAGIGAFGLLTSAIGSAVGMLDEAHEAFLADAASVAALTGQIERNVPAWDGNTAAIDGYISAQINRGISDDDARASIGLLVGVTHDLEEAQRLGLIAMDLARAKNIDLETATKAVMKAQAGNGAALVKLGIDIGGATTAADLLAAAQRSVGGAADDWAATNEGKLAISNAKVGESMEKVGAIVSQVAEVVLPILADAFTKVIDVITQVWDATQPLREVLGPVLQAVFGAIGAIIGAVADQVRSIVKSIQDAVKFAQDLAAALGPSGGAGDFRNQFQERFGRPPSPIEFSQYQAGTLPGFAGGTPGGRSGFARVGELGPEIAGLPGGVGILSASQTRAALAAAGGGQVVSLGGVTINATGVNDPEQLARDTLRAIRRELDRQGMSLA